MSIYPSQYAQIPEGDLMSWNTDRDVEPVVMTRGIMYKTGGVWYFWDGQSRSADAGLFRVSALGVTVTTSPLSADGSSVSALQGDAAKLRISAYADDAAKFRVSAIGTLTVSAHEVKQSDAAAHRVSVFSDDASLFRVNVVSGSAAGISANQELSARCIEGTAFIGSVSCGGGLVSATMKEGSAFIGQVSSILKDNPVNATYLGRVSAITTTALLVSAHEVKQSDAASLRVSALGVTLATAQALSATCKEGTSFIGQVSATLKAGTASIGLVSATLKEGTAFVGQVSAILKDNATTNTYLGRTSSIQGDAANQQTSCKSNDAGTLRTSSYLPNDTVGGLTVFQTLSISASQNVKSTAGSLYGYYLYNTDTKPNYVKIYNVSAAANIGTDTPILTICLPASAAANAWFGQGLKGFTDGINVTATSGRPLDNTALPAASSVGGNLFYA